MAVAVSASGTVATNASSGAQSYTGITVNAGDTALVVWIANNNGTNLGTGAGMPVWNGTQTLTQLVVQSAAGGALPTVGLFGLVNPASGNNTLTFQNNAFNLCLCAQSYKGTGGSNATAFGTTVGTNALSTGPASVTISGATGDLLVGGFVDGALNITAVSDSSVFIQTATFPSSAGNYAPGATSHALTATLSGSSQWAAVALDLLAAGGVVGSPGTFQNRMISYARQAYPGL